MEAPPSSVAVDAAGEKGYADQQRDYDKRLDDVALHVFVPKLTARANLSACGEGAKSDGGPFLGQSARSHSLFAPGGQMQPTGAAVSVHAGTEGYLGISTGA